MDIKEAVKAAAPGIRIVQCQEIMHAVSLKERGISRRRRYTPPGSERGVRLGNYGTGCEFNWLRGTGPLTKEDILCSTGGF